MVSVSLLLVRIVVGGLLAGHGAQKLFGVFGGGGPAGTARYFEGLRLRPADFWARAAGTSELAGGGLTALGIFSPIGPIVSLAPMIVAWAKQHRGKPIWSSAGGAELPLINMTTACALILSGPGALSLDRLLGIRVPWWLTLLAMTATAGGIVVATDEEIREVADGVRAEEERAEAMAEENVPSAT
jgi:putative oxidoreductase